VCNLLQLAGPIATIVASGAAVYVAWKVGQGQLAIGGRQADSAEQQAKLADTRLRHDLYDRRFKIYEAARALVIAVFRRVDVSQDDFFAFVAGTADAVFLLDADMVAYFEEMRTKALRLQRMNRLINEPPAVPEPDQTNAPREKADLGTWFVAQNEVLVEKFKPFLAL
jgi:hypothetical protein